VKDVRVAQTSQHVADTLAWYSASFVRGSGFVIDDGLTAA
jgi:hypothetical protein